VKKLGPSFFYELQEAGLSGLQFSWNNSGSILYGPDLTDEERARIEAAVQAHDPNAEAPEPAVVPSVVSRWQGREAMRVTAYGDLAIEDGGVSLFDATEALLARPETPDYYRVAWDEIQQFEIDSPVLLAIADELGLAAADLVALFKLAATLRA